MIPVFSILLPTRARPSLLLRLLDSLADTADDVEAIEVVLYLDEDDLESQGIEHEVTIRKIVRPYGRSMGDIINECYKASTGRYIVLMNDDAVFATRGWDKLISDAFMRYPDGVALVYGDDLDQGKKVPTFPVLSQKVFEVAREIVPRRYQNLHIESHLFDIFTQLKILGHDRVVYLKDVVIEHLHYTVGKSRLDATYVKRDPAADQRMFIELDGERKYIARRLSRHIEAVVAEERSCVNVAGSDGPSREDPGSPAVAPRVSIVVRAPEAEHDTTMDYLGSLIGASSGDIAFEVIVAGALTARDLPPYLSSLNGTLKIVDIERESTRSSALNRGAACARGEYIVFIDKLVMPAPGWLDAFVRAASESGAGVVGPKHLNPVNGRIHYVGTSFFREASVLKATTIYRGLEPDRRAVVHAREFQAVSAACMLVQREGFKRVGGFDESLESGADIDLCMKMRESGLKVVYTPDVEVFCPDSVPGCRYLPDPVELAALDKRRGQRLESDLFDLLRDDGFVECAI